MPPCIQRNQIDMQQEISHDYFITRHSESICCIYKRNLYEGMPQKQSHKCKPRKVICKRVRFFQIKMLKLSKSTEGSQVAMPFQST